MKALRRWVFIEIVLIHLVVLAGSVVRMTGSGMGCPDWPKCFGHLIPPTRLDELIWAPEKSFKTGQMILHEERLWVARQEVPPSEQLDLSLWKVYTKHDYALFNPFHTWTEYINRLLGALSGIPMLLIFGMIAVRTRARPAEFLLALAALLLLGFEAWLGKVVVDGNLIPGQITLHMLGALLLIGVLFLLHARLAPLSESRLDRGTTWTLLGLLVLVLGQIAMGTQVREAVDTLGKASGGLPRGAWIQALPGVFLVHRSFSWLVLIASVYLFWRARRKKWSGTRATVVLGLCALNIGVGVVLAYTGLPPALQPVHLMLAVLLFGALVRALAAERAWTALRSA